MSFVSRALRAAFVLFLLAQASPSAHAWSPVPFLPDCDPPAPTGAPIDGGASLLLAGGAAYAVRRIRQARRQ